MIQLEACSGAEPLSADLVVFDFDDLADFTCNIADLLQNPPDVVTLDLRPMTHRPFTVLDALDRICATHHRQRSTVRVLCLLNEGLAYDKAIQRLRAKAFSPATRTFQRIEVRIVVNDLTRIRADAIVNASNCQLRLGAGVSGAIRRAAAMPEALQAEMTRRGPIEAGAVVATGSYGLPMTNLLLHASTASGSPEVISRSLQRSLELADELDVESLAMPALGTGTGGLTVSVCAELLRAAVENRANTTGSLKRLVCVLYDADSALEFVRVFEATSSDRED